MEEVIYPKASGHLLTFIPLTWKIWRVPNNASRWQMVFNSALKGLKDAEPEKKIIVILKRKILPGGLKFLLFGILHHS